MHDWGTLGNRPKKDLDKVKCSEIHHWGPDWWATEFVGGRSKLADGKTRVWRNWRLCLCPNEEHHAPGNDIQIGPDGNPTTPLDRKYCTTCPVFCGQLLRKLQDEEDLPFRIWRHWRPQTFGFGQHNHPNIVTLARQWLVNQGEMVWDTPFCPHGGRKALAAWCELLNVHYWEGVHVYGDLEDVWRKYYQPGLPMSNNYNHRDQSLDPQIAAAALKKFRRFLGRERPPEPLPAHVPRGERALLLMSRALGLYDDVLRLYA